MSSSIRGIMFRVLLLLPIVMATSLAAQTAVIGGTVLRDSAGKPLGEAEVAIPSLSRGTRANYLGEFRLDRLPAGKYAVVFRHVGFTPRTDTITLKDGQVVDDEFVMTETPVQLNAQQTVASADRGPLYLQEFNDRMKVGFGHFVTDSMLRHDADNRNFMNYIKARLPGMRVTRGPGGAEYLSSGRKACSGPAFSCVSARPCYVTVYVDGIADYVSGVSHGEPTDFAHLKSEDFAAVEYYASGATAPSRYNQTGSDCGILLLWRRYRAP